MNADETRNLVAQQAYDQAKDKKASEKIIEVDNETFMKCISDKTESAKEFDLGRGFIRTYHKPFLTKIEGMKGQMYNHGVVYVINKDLDINKPYQVTVKNEDMAQEVNFRLRHKNHRLKSIDIESHNDKVVLTFTKQLWNFDEA